MSLNDAFLNRILDLETTDVFPVYEAAIALTQENHAGAHRDEPPDLKRCRTVAERLVHAHRERPMDFMLLALRPQGLPSFLEAHPVNVTIILLELLQGWSACPADPLDVALLGLLHDVGIVKVEDLVRQPRRLTEGGTGRHRAARAGDA